VLSTVEKECGTLKKSVWELSGEGGLHRINMVQGFCLRMGDCAAMWLR